MLPAHRGRVEHGQQSGPRLRLGDVVEVVGQHVAGVVREGHLDGAELAQGPAYGGLGRSQPPDEVVLGAGPEAAQPAADQLEVTRLGGRLGHRLPQPLLGERPPRPRRAPVALVAAPEDTGPGGQRAEHAGGDREAAAVGLARRELQPSRERRDRLAQLGGGGGPGLGQGPQDRGVHPVEPHLAALGDAVRLDLLGQPGVQLPGPRGREALPHTSGSRSRGKVNRVRRIASCLTTERSV